MWCLHPTQIPIHLMPQEKCIVYTDNACPSTPSDISWSLVSMRTCSGYGNSFQSSIFFLINIIWFFISDNMHINAVSTQKILWLFWLYNQYFGLSPFSLISQPEVYKRIPFCFEIMVFIMFTINKVGTNTCSCCNTFCTFSFLLI